MKTSKFATLIICGLALTLGVVGCKKKPGYLTPLPGQRAGLVGDDGTSGMMLDPNAQGINTADDTFGIPQNPAGSHLGWNENAEALKAQTVYFDFDSSSIRSSEQSKVAAVADYLKANSGAAVRVEGHCDERGTEEYNRALGERRALAVREELVRQGIDPGRVDTLSYGEDRPAVQGNTDDAYAQNRRDEFIVLTPP